MEARKLSKPVADILALAANKKYPITDDVSAHIIECASDDKEIYECFQTFLNAWGPNKKPIDIFGYLQAAEPNEDISTTKRDAKIFVVGNELNPKNWRGLFDLIDNAETVSDIQPLVKAYYQK